MGVNVDQDTLEVTENTSILKWLQSKWIPPKMLEYYKGAEADYQSSVSNYQNLLDKVVKASEEANGFKAAILELVEHKDFTVDGLQILLTNSNPEVVEAAKGLLAVFESWYSFDYLESRKVRYQTSLDYHYNLEFDTRKDIVLDDIDNAWEKGYGNNDVKGPVGSHGHM